MFDRRQFLGLGLAAALGLLMEPVSALAADGGSSTSRSSRNRSDKKSGDGKRSSRKRSSRSSRSRAAESESRRAAERSGESAASEKAVSRSRASEAPLEDLPDLNTRQPSVVERSGLGESGEEAQGDQAVRDYLFKMRNFDAPAPGDVILTGARRRLLDDVMARLDRVQKQVGHGWFYLLGMDEAIRTAKRSAVGEFPRQELAFLDELFHSPASSYGFMDRKPLDGFTARIDKNRVTKVPRMGNFVYKGEAEAKWQAIQRLMGDDVVLTSGVRGVVKQFHLFLAKAQRYDGNLSLASRSLAPPGYSFHGVGDFDVGQRGFGVRNFMADFTQTPVFNILSEKGYISLRYPRDNFLGVRFEPWHVKVVDV